MAATTLHVTCASTVIDILRHGFNGVLNGHKGSRPYTRTAIRHFIRHFRHHTDGLDPDVDTMTWSDIAEVEAWLLHLGYWLTDHKETPGQQHALAILNKEWFANADELIPRIPKDTRNYALAKAGL